MISWVFQKAGELVKHVNTLIYLQILLRNYKFSRDIKLPRQAYVPWIHQGLRRSYFDGGTYELYTVYRVAYLNSLEF